MIILKFGGSSVGTPKSIKAVKKIIFNTQKTQKNNFAVIFSAFGGITDHLIQMGKLAERGNKTYQKEFDELKVRHYQAITALLPVAKQKEVLEKADKLLDELEGILHGVCLIKELSERTLDLIMSFGERLSNTIISESLQADGIKAEFLDSRRLIKTDDNFSNARVDFKRSYSNIRKHFRKHDSLQIITGFLGSTNDGVTSTLGRGGSDYSASLFAAALDAREIQIWTDVDGVMTADPRKVKQAFSLDKISYKEAMEMSHFGAKVIHPPTMRPALDKNIPIRIKNTFNIGFPGTVIQSKTTDKHTIKGISSISHMSLLTLSGSGLQGSPGTAMRLFSSLAQEKINVILISQASSEHSICFAVNPDDEDRAKKIIDHTFRLEIHDKQINPIKIEKNLSILAIVGDNMKKRIGTAGKLFQALGDGKINTIAIAQGSSERNISVVIEHKEQEKALNVIHKAFFN